MINQCVVSIYSQNFSHKVSYPSRLNKIIQTSKRYQNIFCAWHLPDVTWYQERVSVSFTKCHINLFFNIAIPKHIFKNSSWFHIFFKVMVLIRISQNSHKTHHFEYFPSPGKCKAVSVLFSSYKSIHKKNARINFNGAPAEKNILG